MAVGIAGGIGERPSCRSAVPAWPPSLAMGLLGVSLGKKGLESWRWVCASPRGGFSLAGTPGTHLSCCLS